MWMFIRNLLPWPIIKTKEEYKEWYRQLEVAFDVIWFAVCLVLVYFVWLDWFAVYIAKTEILHTVFKTDWAPFGWRVAMFVIVFAFYSLYGLLLGYRLWRWVREPVVAYLKDRQNYSAYFREPTENPTMTNIVPSTSWLERLLKLFTKRPPTGKAP